jgi:diguanylate cyclase (GGDEF)-like protein/PAS domain S-box-containing protein
VTSWSRRVSVATARPSVSTARSRSGERDALLAEAVAHGVVDSDLAALAAMVDAAVAHPGLATTVVVHGELEGVVAELAFEVLHSANGAEVRLLDGPVLAPGRRAVAHLGVADADEREALAEGQVELDGEAVRNVLSDTLVETPDMVAVFASVGREALWANDAFVTLIPIRESDKIWLVELLDEWSRGHYEVKVLPALVKFGRWRGRLTFVSDAGPLPVSAVMVAHRDQSGDIVQVALVARDLSELRAAEERVNATETRFAALVEQVSDLIVVVDPDGTIRYLSPAVSRTLGHDEGHLEGTNVLDLVHPEDRPADLPTLAQPTDQGIGSPVVLRVAASDDSWRHLEVIVTDLTLNPAIGGVVLNARDVTERVMAARELANRAFTDPLTGLPNRVRLLDRLESLMETDPADVEGAAAGPAPVIALVCDIDEFKPLNTVVGPAGGDALLREVADRLAAVVEAPATLARLGGASFVAVIAGPPDVMAAMRLANRIRSTVGAPISLDGRQVELSLSVGIAEGVVGDDPERLVRRAEQAMARARHDGGDRTELFDGALAEESTRRDTIDQQLRNALDHDGLRVHFQPIIDIESDQVVAAEALLRVHDNDGTVMSPAEFVEAAESGGLISQLGLQVLQATCEQLAVWSSRGDGQVPREVSVNVSPRQLADPDLPTQVQQVLAATGVDPSQLSLEITESILIGAEPTVDAGISYLRSLGVRIGLDDFGTGQSSLGYLKRFPLDFVKIDRTLVAGLGIDEQDTAIVRATIELAHNLGLVVTAVGVENEEQLEALGILGCDRAQGYLFAPAVPADQLGTVMTGGSA